MKEDRNIAAGNPEHKALFSGLIMMLGSSAMQQLGKLINPVTGKTEISLDGAQATIDLLDMLKAKTQGNLDSEEEKMLRDLLASLQMNYVHVAEAVKKTPAEPASAATEQKSAESESTPDVGAEATASRPAPTAAPEKKEAHQPKFHKSYGS